MIKISEARDLHNKEISRVEICPFCKHAQEDKFIFDMHMGNDNFHIIICERCKREYWSTSVIKKTRNPTDKEIIKEISLKLQEQYNQFLEAVEEENESINKFADMLKENGEGGLHPDDLGDLGRRIERVNYYYGRKQICVQIAQILWNHYINIGKLESCFRRD